MVEYGASNTTVHLDNAALNPLPSTMPASVATSIAEASIAPLQRAMDRPAPRPLHFLAVPSGSSE
jgi:hypothetical protein